MHDRLQRNISILQVTEASTQTHTHFAIKVSFPDRDSETFCTCVVVNADPLHIAWRESLSYKPGDV